MPSTHIRQHVLPAAKHIVVKYGTQTLTGSDGNLDVAFFREIARQVSELRKQGRQVTVVSSGAIGAGRKELGLAKRPTDVAELQAVAAVGQRRLMTHLHEAFAPFGLGVGQLLVTRDDFDHRARYLNIRNCIAHLHRLGCVPILNENDTVAVDEIRFGDNDQLAGLTCNALRADALVLLSVVNGLLDDRGQRVDYVDSIAKVLGHVRSEKSDLGTGGMSSKLAAAKLATEAGEVAIIANGRETDVLPRLFSGQSAGVGTVFAPAAKKLDSRSRWIGMTRRPAGEIAIDDGAVAALSRGKSLLPAGVVSVKGDFEKGAVVAVKNKAGDEVARGLCNYAAAEVDQIKGKKTSQLEAVLGRVGYAEVIHRDNLVASR